MFAPLLNRLLLAGALALSTSCATHPVLRRNWHPDHGLKELLLLTERSFAQIDDLVAEARIDFRGHDGGGSATAAIVYLAPDKLHIDVRGPFMSRLLTTVVDGDSMTISAGGQTWQGSTAQGLRTHLTAMHLTRYDLRYALLGIVAPLRGDAEPLLSYSRADRVVAAAVEDGLERRIWIDLHNGFVSREEGVPVFGSAWRRDLEEYRRVAIESGTFPTQTIYLPKRVRIRQEGTSLQLEYRSYRINQGVSEALFARDQAAR